MASAGDTRSRQLGVALVVASAICWSTAGLFVRVANLDSATLLFWSSFSACLSLLIICAVRIRRELIRQISMIGMPELLYILISTVNNTSYVIALNSTSIANVMTIYASLPFVATIAAFFLLKERVSIRFLLSGGMAMLGVAITAGAAGTANDIYGLIAAFISTSCFAVQLVLAKRYPKMDILLITALSAGVSTVLFLPFTDFASPTRGQLLGGVLYGIIPCAVGLPLVLAGGRRVKSGEAAFITMLDVVLGPIWVWLSFGERPTDYALVGGAMVLGAVAWYLSKEAVPSTVS
ncbi:DMT family transporter [Hyphomicrobium facile]|uniref:EamA-like transporter family protein n=1 Tax=Hyphomicrobium facile TaxID=51670 RepID=A0A1I7NDT3_9HYPH|nr:DMT family transporter [Hyphomicrobium facile]SFV32848.1 EamA-like transporter family protein [Hyphomicrobium facile]